MLRILVVGILGTVTKRWAIFAKCELCLKSKEKDTRGLLARVAYWDHKLRRDYQQPLLVCSKACISICICSTEATSSESMEQSLDIRGPFTEYYEVSSAPGRWKGQWSKKDQLSSFGRGRRCLFWASSKTRSAGYAGGVSASKDSAKTKKKKKKRTRAQWLPRTVYCGIHVGRLQLREV